MVERSLSMWEVGGSIPPVSKTFSSLLFTNIACNHAWVGSMWLLNYYQRKKVCIVRESNPGRPRGRRAFYHWTNDARYPTRLSGTTWQWVHKWDLRNMCSKWLQLKQKKRQKLSRSVGFEPTPAERNWFLVSRLNHSAKTARWWWHRHGMVLYTSFDDAII